MLREIIQQLFGGTPKEPAPPIAQRPIRPYSPADDGWYRVDLQEGRPVRFKLESTTSSRPVPGGGRTERRW